MNRRGFLKTIAASLIGLMVPEQDKRHKQKAVRMEHQRDAWQETAREYAVNAAYWRKEAEVLGKMFVTGWQLDRRPEHRLLDWDGRGQNRKGAS